ncbi:eCIS core domain-containing protein [Cellulomonas aerilata]|uniref:eCIS core domain-containing protein n=1 Tax=Cellulomonas aerilata TaxID=515326 RepID=A0A512D9Y3_9CELL|nr:DUF4157 domain-containing protein [Cellulomonas aerilata]GEO33294.1 hypothetical protein CAE01nite_10190 [Cellulomonas aerilata]
MHRHEHDQGDVESVRPRGARVDEAADGRLWQAAAEGRADVVGPQGLLRLQRAVGNRGVAGLSEEGRSPVLDVVSSGGGRALDAPVRTEMEARLGADFGDVRVHTDDAAHRSAAAVDAHAYTVGSNVVFQRGRYDPGSTEGRTMLAHELTHVVQQRSGPVDGTPTGGGVRVSSPSDRFEREAAATAERAMSAPAPTAAPTVARTGTPGAGGAPVQREATDVADTSVQGVFVQRADAAPEEEQKEEPVQGAFVQRQGEEEQEESA